MVIAVVAAFAFAATPAEAHFGPHPGRPAAHGLAKHQQKSNLPAAPAKEPRGCCGICALTGAGAALPTLGPVILPPGNDYRATPAGDRDRAPGRVFANLPRARAPPASL